MLGIKNVFSGQYVKNVASLVDFVCDFNGQNKLHLAIASLVPSPKTQHLCDKNFVTTDATILSLLKVRPDKCSFLDLSGLLRFENGSIKKHLFHDGIHLNHMATRWLAEHIGNFVSRICHSKV